MFLDASEAELTYCQQRKVEKIANKMTVSVTSAVLTPK